MYYILIFTILIILSIAYFKLADKFNIIDKPNHRSSHKTPTIRGGGILFYIATLIYFFTSGFQYPYFFLGITLIAFVSFIDDIITLSSTIRLPFQFIAIGLCLFQIGFPINDLLIIIPILIIGVGFINIYNFMDGINGITGFYSIITLVLFYFINLKESIIDNNLIIYVLFSIIIFGFYNFRKKARMFSGDIGSISIAVLLFFIGVYFIKELHSPILILTMLIYGTDSLLTLVYRKYIGEKITVAHKKHIYQKLVNILNLPHLTVSSLFALLQLLVNVLVYCFYKESIVVQMIIIFFSIIFSASTYFIVFKYIENKRLVIK